MAALRTQNTGSGTGVITAQLTGVQAGDLLAVCFYERDGTSITSIADDVNGAWTVAVTRAVTAARAGIYYFENSGAGNPTLTVTISGTSPRDMNFSAWSGMDTTSALDTTNNAGNSSATAHSHGAVTPSASSLILTALGLGAAHGGISLHSGFTVLNIDGSVADADRRVYAYKLAHTGTITPSHTSTNAVSSDAVVAAFLESGGGGGGNVIAWITA